MKVIYCGVEVKDILDKDNQLLLIKPPVLVITLEEAIALADCPFSNNFASEHNYPGYNAALTKIKDFARDYRDKK